MLTREPIAVVGALKPIGCRNKSANSFPSSENDSLRRGKADNRYVQQDSEPETESADITYMFGQARSRAKGAEGLCTRHHEDLLSVGNPESRIKGLVMLAFPHGPVPTPGLYLTIRSPVSRISAYSLDPNMYKVRKMTDIVKTTVTSRTSHQIARTGADVKWAGPHQW